MWHRAGTRGLRLCLVPILVLAWHAACAYAHDGDTCRLHAAEAERAWHVPNGLLLAIGRQESGRWDAATEAVQPWPWTVNREGEGRYFASRAEAVAYVETALRSGSRSIDVGCFQINLMHHPTAFLSLEHAFDPAANAMYAGRFLTELFSRTASWEAAVGAYHSADPLRGVPYRLAVLAAWRGGARTIERAVSPLAGDGPAGLLLQRSFLGINVWVPHQLADGSEPAVARRFPRTTRAAVWPAVSSYGASATAHGRGWPRVITPSGTRSQWTAVR